MVDLRVLERHGVTAKAWKAKLELQDTEPSSKSRTKPRKLTPEEEKIQSFRERIRSRVNEGREDNLNTFRTFYALDLIWRAPYRQISATLLSELITRYPGNVTKDLEGVLQSLGFNTNDVIINSTEIDTKTQQPIKKLNVPVFLAITIPMVRAYLEIRLAKLVNDRNRRPMLKFEPAAQTPLNRARCELVNSVMQSMSDNYGHLSDLITSIFQMLLYGTHLEFIREAWHREEQARLNDSDKEETYIVREGLRYHHPHPTRVFWDMAFPARSINVDSGCEFAGYWRVLRYKELRDNKAFYNLEKIAVGNTEWWSAPSTRAFFHTVYASAIITPPQLPSTPDDCKDREQWMSDHSYYCSDMGDHSVITTEYFERLIPAEVGLGDYKFPIWARFVVAGDGTIVYAEPCGCRPVTVYKDNGDDKLRDDASLALKLAPFQDQASNLLTQFLMAAKQNLTNLTLVDENVVEPEWIKTLRNVGETAFRRINIYSFDSRKLLRMQVNANQNAIYSHRFPQLDTNGILLALKTVIDLAERVLQFSSQEVAQAAQHQQTKAEVEKIYASTTNILQFTGIPVDQGLCAAGLQRYEAFVNYGSEEFLATIPADHQLTDKELKELGVVQGDVDATRVSGDQRLEIKTKRSAIRLGVFAVLPMTADRVENVEAAQVLSTFLRDLLGNPVTQMAIGPGQAMLLANQIARLAGLPLDAKLRDMTPEQPQQGQDMLKQVIDQVLGQARTEMKQGLAPVFAGMDDMGKTMQKIQEVLGQVNEQLNVLYKAVGIGQSAPDEQPVQPVIDNAAVQPANNGYPEEVQPGTSVGVSAMAGGPAVQPAIAPAPVPVRRGIRLLD